MFQKFIQTRDIIVNTEYLFKERHTAGSVYLFVGRRSNLFTYEGVERECVKREKVFVERVCVESKCV